MPIPISILLTILILLTALLSISILRLRKILKPPPRSAPNLTANGRSHILIVLGSGGHTAEMFSMLSKAVLPSTPLLPDPGSILTENQPPLLDWYKFAQRTYIISSGDSLSAARAKEFEDAVERLYASPTHPTKPARKGSKDLNRQSEQRRSSGRYDILTVPRAREIHQSLFTAPRSCLRCAVVCWKILHGTEERGRRGHVGYPDLIFCNGPATAAIMVGVSVVVRFLNIGGCESKGKMRTVYVESWARVKRLSLTGKLLKNVVHRFVVQWPQLAGGRAQYRGVLVA